MILFSLDSNWVIYSPTVFIQKQNILRLLLEKRDFNTKLSQRMIG